MKTTGLYPENPSEYDVNFKEILDFLHNYAGHGYKSPDNIKDDIYKKEIEDIKKMHRNQ